MNPNVCITRKFQFCSGHRVMGHENKCAHVHGHNYEAHVYCQAVKLDDIGRVIDFSVVKQLVGDWIDDKWDHGFIANKDDVELLDALANFKPRAGVIQKIFTMDANPTAEVMAAHLLEVAQGLLAARKIRVTKVVLFETPNCWATVKA